MNDRVTSVTTYVYDSASGTVYTQPAVGLFSADEMESLLLHLGTLKTNLLWLACEWARQLRQEPSCRPAVEQHVERIFANLGKRLLDHLQRNLVDPPAVILDLPPPPTGERDAR